MLANKMHTESHCSWYRQGANGDHTGAVGNTGGYSRRAAHGGAEGRGYVVLPAEGLPPLRRQILHIGVHVDVGRGQQVILLLQGILIGLLQLLLLIGSRFIRLLDQSQGLGWLNLGLGQVLLDFDRLLALEEVGDHGALALHIHAAPAGELEAAPLKDLLHLLGHLVERWKEKGSDNINSG